MAEHGAGAGRARRRARLREEAEAEHGADGVAPGAVQRGEERRALAARARARQQRAQAAQLHAPAAFLSQCIKRGRRP